MKRSKPRPRRGAAGARSPAKAKPPLSFNAVVNRCQALADAVAALPSLDPFQKGKLTVMVGRVQRALDEQVGFRL